MEATQHVETYGLTREQLLDIDYYLRLTRTMEERLVALFRQAKVIGAKPADIIKQYMAKGDSPTRGRELNIHFGHPARDGFIGQISMLGDMIPVMAGIALAGRMQKKSLVTLAFIGDGASSTGAFYEGMNFASVQRLPMVVCLENNGYAYSTPTSRQTAARSLV